MVNQETLRTKDVNFLSIEEEKTLKKQAFVFGQQCANAGIPIVNINLVRLIDLARNKKTASFVPADFLESASIKLRENGAKTTDIFTLYSKWFQFDDSNTKSIQESDTVGEIQISFVNLAAKFTVEEKDPEKQKQTLAKSIDFIDKNSSDQQSKVAYLMFYGKYLFEHGMKKQGRKIVQTTAKSEPEIISELLDLEAIVEQVSEE